MRTARVCARRAGSLEKPTVAVPCDVHRAVRTRQPHPGEGRARQQEESGACYIELGRADDAEKELLLALAEQSSPRRQGMVMADLAMVGVLRRDRGHAAHYVGQALDIARATGSGVVTRKLANVQTRILEAL